ncbi:heavy metal-responsive transcriptional regulator [Luteimonas saliphila]|uniref:heavy metal-responsive transcriptional regulator n=1 Tax=Luteimonas saliphila TaxID=2804919 RepID=UPI003CCCA9F4
MSIGQLAQQAGVAIDTVRYYERSALLAPAGRLASGYRRYGSAEVKRLRFIRRAKALGFSLEDIRELLSLGEGCTDPSSPDTHLSSRPKGEIPARTRRSLPAVEMTTWSDVAAVKRAAQRRLADVEARIAELERMRDGLRTLVAACPGHGRAEACPILNALAGEDAE